MWLKEKQPQESLLDAWDLVHIDWFIVFEHGDMPWKLAKLLKPGYRHCYAVRYDGHEWIYFHPHLGHTDIRVMAAPPGSTIFDVVSTGYSAIIHIDTQQKVGKVRQAWPTFFTCVEQIKALLGIRAGFVFTPWKLYKLLKGKGYGFYETENAREIARAGES